ncbi:MAG TPA: NUDIX domain-containing protein [Longimicrobiales bacterium]|nr:NUDIX domain-containing protein [Longimicrobiales bacterium]
MGEAPRSPRGRRRGRDARRARVETSSGGVVFRRGGGALDFLLIRDPYNNWGLPKGHIEGGETPAEAALREVSEETGLIELAVITQLPTIDWFFRDRGKLVHKFCHFFLVESPTGDPEPQLTEGITECVWRSAGLAIETVSYSNAREVMRAAARWLTGAGELPAENAGELELRNPVR